MLASFPPDSAKFSADIDPENPWWIGEKYDGVRACWNSSEQQLYPILNLVVIFYLFFDTINI